MNIKMKSNLMESSSVQIYINKRIEITDETPDFECIICSMVLWDPLYCTSCECFFCKKCISKWKNNHQECPQCRNSPVVTHSPMKYYINKLNKLGLKCKNKPNGCDYESLYENYSKLQQHEEHCQYELIICNNPGCSESYLRKESSLHLENCIFATVNCPICNQSMIRQELSNHKCVATKDEIIAQLREQNQNLQRQLKLANERVYSLDQIKKAYEETILQLQEEKSRLEENFSTQVSTSLSQRDEYERNLAEEQLKYKAILSQYQEQLNKYSSPKDRVCLICKKGNSQNLNFVKLHCSHEGHSSCLSDEIIKNNLKCTICNSQFTDTDIDLIFQMNVHSPKVEERIWDISAAEFSATKKGEVIQLSTNKKIAKNQSKQYWGSILGSEAFSSFRIGKCKFRILDGNFIAIGVARDGVDLNKNFDLTNYGFGYGISGHTWYNSESSAYGSSYAKNDIITVIFDPVKGSVSFEKNSEFQGIAFSNKLFAKTPFYPAVSLINNSSVEFISWE